MLVAALLGLAIFAIAGLPRAARRPGTDRAIAVFAVGSVPATSSRSDTTPAGVARAGPGASGDSGADIPRAASAPADTRVRSDDAAVATATTQSAAIAQLIGDDPLAGFADLPYRRSLERHIRPHLRYPAARGAGTLKGTVRLLARLSRDGTVIDVRVAGSAGALLDDAAIQAIWRAQPMPRVPDSLAIPLVVEIPIGFDGAMLRASAL